MVERDDETGSYLQAFDVENRLVMVTDTQTLSVTQFVYDGAGNRVLTIWPDESETAYVGEHYEVEGELARSYYYFGSQRIAMRIDDGVNEDVYWFHTDHLGSTSLLSDENGDDVDGSTARFLPFGGYRVEPEAGLTDKGFTGHAHNDNSGLIYMRARFFVPSLGRFAQADSIVPNPQNPQSFNRYSYVNNRPLVAIDPTGHAPSDGCDYEGCSLLPGLDPDSTWLLPNGAIFHVDPNIVAAEDYNPITEGVLPSLGILFIMIAGGEPVILYLGEAIGAERLLQGLISAGGNMFGNWIVGDEITPGEVAGSFGSGVIFGGFGMNLPSTILQPEAALLGLGNAGLFGVAEGGLATSIEVFVDSVVLGEELSDDEVADMLAQGVLSSMLGGYAGELLSPAVRSFGSAAGRGSGVADWVSGLVVEIGETIFGQ
jgi:RHS repeat-associated protein